MTTLTHVVQTVTGKQELIKCVLLKQKLHWMRVSVKCININKNFETNKIIN